MFSWLEVFDYLSFTTFTFVNQATSQGTIFCFFWNTIFSFPLYIQTLIINKNYKLSFVLIWIIFWNDALRNKLRLRFYNFIVSKMPVTGVHSGSAMGKLFQGNCTEKKINTMHSTCAHSWAWLTLPGLHEWLGTLAPSLLTNTEFGRWCEKLQVWRRNKCASEIVFIFGEDFPFNPELLKLCYHRHREHILTF